jgi:hypothetical protein
MAREAGAWSQQFKNRDVDYVMSAESLERFAALVRVDEHKRLLAMMKQMHDAYALSSYPSGFKPKDEMPLFDDWGKDWK